MATILQSFSQLNQACRQQQATSSQKPCWKTSAPWRSRAAGGSSSNTLLSRVSNGSHSKVFHPSAHEIKSRKSYSGYWTAVLVPNSLAKFTISAFPVPYSSVDEVCQGNTSGMTPRLLHEFLYLLKFCVRETKCSTKGLWFSAHKNQMVHNWVLQNLNPSCDFTNPLIFIYFFYS